MTRKPRWTVESIALFYAPSVGRQVQRRYHAYGVRADDTEQEVYVWVFGEGRERIEAWLAGPRQQQRQCFKAMLNAGLRYAEMQKAEQAGYSVVDLYYYSPSALEDLMPLVLNPEFTEASGGIGELITAVLDIRRCMTPELYEFFEHFDNTHPAWNSSIQELLNRLGSQDRPFVGGSRGVSNAQAQAITREAYG